MVDVQVGCGCREVADTSHACTGRAFPILREHVSISVFFGVRQFESAACEEFDAVVGHGIVGCGDHGTPFPRSARRSGMRRQGLNNARVDHIGNRLRTCLQTVLRRENRRKRGYHGRPVRDDGHRIRFCRRHRQARAPRHRPNPMQAVRSKPYSPILEHRLFRNIRGMSLKSSLSQVILPCTIVLNGFTIQRNSREHVAIPAYCGT